MSPLTGKYAKGYCPIFAFLLLLGPMVDSQAQGLIGAGNGHTCAVQPNGAVQCWGSNDYGQATPPTGAFRQLDVGGFHACALRHNGRAICWGNDGDGQSSPPPVPLRQLSAGWVHSCGVTTEGQALCWGNNGSNRSNPPGGTFTQVSAGDGHSCGIRTDGEVSCWGDNGVGQASPPPGPFSQISVGGNAYDSHSHSCGLRPSGAIVCWGDDGVGQSSPPPGTFVQLSAGFDHNCAIRADGSGACWGDSRADWINPPPGIQTQVSAGVFHSCWVADDGTVNCRGTEDAGRATPPAADFVQVSAGPVNSCALGSDGALGCWGDRGDGLNDPPAGSFQQVGLGNRHACALRLDGGVACWGGGVSFGQQQPPPVAYTQISVGEGFFNCGVQVDGALSCWGNDTSGQASPPAGRFSQVSAGLQHSCGVREDGAVDCWGDNFFGQTNAPQDGPFSQVATGWGRSCGVRVDGMVTCWGDDRYPLAPEDPATPFAQVSAGGSGVAGHSCGIRRDDGGVVCWGGQGTNQLRPPAGRFSQVSVGASHACGVRTNDERVVCWGYDGYGPITPPPDLITSTAPGQLAIDTTRLFNISTNGPVSGPGLQAGFIVAGQSRRFAILGEAMDGQLDAQLTLESFPDGTLIDSNDTWRSHPSAGEIETSLRPPARESDAAFAITLNAGAYVATLSDQKGTPGQGVVAVTALDDQDQTYPLNISTNGGGEMIAGFIVTGSEGRCYVVKAEGVGTGAMADPALLVSTFEGEIIDANDDWQTHPSADLIAAAGFAPLHPSEAALALRLQDGVYLAQLQSQRTSGVGDRAIVAATELPEDLANQFGCDANTPYEPQPISDVPVADPSLSTPSITLQIAAPANECVEYDADGHCVLYQAEDNVSTNQLVHFVAQGQSAVPGEVLDYLWALGPDAAGPELEVEAAFDTWFRAPGNQDIQVTVTSPSAGALTSTLRIRVLEPEPGGGR